ncbi:FliH/SctL family protein [Massilia eburnea]|uniref:FliH/SctL family protein n=1 Tax=Massilia eburnea TaxID=1776165 RepID=UPI003D6BB8A2
MKRAPPPSRRWRRYAKSPTNFSTALRDADQAISNEVLELALHLAKGMIKTALRVKPELILPIVREAIEYLPVLQQPALLILNPDDAAVVREGIAEELDKGGLARDRRPHHRARRLQGRYRLQPDRRHRGVALATPEPCTRQGHRLDRLIWAPPTLKCTQAAGVLT